MIETTGKTDTRVAERLESSTNRRVKAVTPRKFVDGKGATKRTKLETSYPMKIRGRVGHDAEAETLGSMADKS